MRDAAVATLCLVAACAAENALVCWTCLAAVTLLTLWPTKRTAPGASTPRAAKMERKPSVKTPFHR